MEFLRNEAPCCSHRMRHVLLTQGTLYYCTEWDSFQGTDVEMLHALVNIFHCLDNRAIQNIITLMQTLQLQDYEDLNVYRDKLENFNLQLSWVGQEMSSSFLVFLAQSQLAKSHYKKDIEALQLSHTASGTSFTSLDDLCQGLECLDELRGLSYGGKAISSPPPTGNITKNTSKHPQNKLSTNVGNGCSSR
jgi:hypothetical protein